MQTHDRHARKPLRFELAVSHTAILFAAWGSALIAGAGCASSDQVASGTSHAGANNHGGSGGATAGGTGGASGSNNVAGSSLGGSGGSGAGGQGGANGGGASGMAGQGGAMMPTGPIKPWDLTGIIGTGQSLSVGTWGTPKLTTSPDQNFKLSLGTLSVPPYAPDSTQLSLVQLVEPIRPTTTAYPSAYPANIFGETPHTAMGSEVSALFKTAFKDDYPTVHTVVGESGQPMSVINKAATATSNMGHAFAASLFEAQAIARIVKGMNKTYGIGAIVLTHGETDNANSNYESDLVQLWSDYNASLAPITGQTGSIPLFLTQQNSSPNGAGSTAASTQAQWRASVDHPGDIVCVGPKYQYPYYSDALHLVAQGYDLLGEKYGEVYFERVASGHDWQPLQPTSIEHTGSTLTVHFHVPVAPLVWDTALKEPHQTALTQWKNGHGFEVADQSGIAVTINSAQIVGDTVVLTCATDPGDGGSVSYAATADGPPMPGGTARWGTLRDSDPFTGATTKQVQPNYAVAFQMPISGNQQPTCTPALTKHSASACTRSCWAASSSDCADYSTPSPNVGLPLSAIDGMASTRYTSGTGQAGSTWFQIDLGAATEIDGVNLDSAASSGDFAASYEVQVSTDGSTWTSVACGSGAPTTDIGFAPQTARYVRILQRGSKGNW